MSSPPNPVPIRKAIFPVAGIGSRFLPATLAVPKEMIPVVDTPLLHHAVAEALQAGVEECIFVVAPERGQRRVIEDYFCDNGALERRLQSAGKGEQAAHWRARLPRPKRVSFALQERPLGLGDAIWQARDMVGDEHFAVLLPDDLLLPGWLPHAAAPPAGFALAAQPVAPADCRKYGILQVRGQTIYGLVEKPPPGEEPSNLAIVGRYILPPEIFAVLEGCDLTDALTALLARGVSGRAVACPGRRFDCGSRDGLVAATIALAEDMQ